MPSGYGGKVPVVLRGQVSIDLQCEPDPDMIFSFVASHRRNGVPFEIHILNGTERDLRQLFAANNRDYPEGVRVVTLASQDVENAFSPLRQRSIPATTPSPAERARLRARGEL